MSASVIITVDNHWSARRALVDALLEENGPVRMQGPSVRRLGLMYWDKKWHRVRITDSVTSHTHLDRSIELGYLAIRAWDGPGKSFHEFSHDEQWLSIGFDERGTASIGLSEPEDRAERISRLLTWVVDREPVIAGGAWGGAYPPWVDTANRWWLRPFAPPFVPGPLWLAVAPPAANELLAGDAEACALAAEVTSLRHGGLWRLVPTPASLTGEVVRRWATVMDRLGLLPADPPVLDLVEGYLTHSHPPLPHRWP